MPEMVLDLYSPRRVMRSGSPSARSTKPQMPCMQPIEMRKNNITKSTSRIVAVLLQPLRHNRSAKSMETMPVSSIVEEKNRNTRIQRPERRAGYTITSGADPEALDVSAAAEDMVNLSNACK